MAKVLILWPANAAVRIGSAEASLLAGIGVSTIALLRDAESVGIVLDGWAFDPVQSARAAAAALGSESECRVLLPALEVDVASASFTGGTDDSTLPRPGRTAGGTRPADR
ncbi:MAG TPA: hypothetical protein VI733_04270 [Candidatus Limnocylindria bacterium]|nr:hypothetical protein [Candidatus Limnocylindria bacterium]